jgi:hypothetical protein
LDKIIAATLGDAVVETPDNLDVFEGGNPTVQADLAEDRRQRTRAKKIPRFKKKDIFTLWRNIVIYEEVPTGKKLEKTLPVEEAMRPPWFSPLYSNWFIGSEIYQPFFGTGSVVDESLFVSSSGAAAFGTGRKEQQEVLDQLKSAGNDRKKVLEILEDAKSKSISDVPDVESSLDALAYLYGEVCRLGLDVHRFVHDYTRRPIATMAEILGSDDLHYKVSEDGNSLKLDTGTPGFHSTAIADVGGRLLGLLDNPDASLPRLTSKGKSDPLSRDLDPRPGRLERVKAYLAEINGSSEDGNTIYGSKGALGVGVQG